MSKNDPTDIELIVDFQQTQSRKAFELLYNKFSPVVYRRCLLMTGSETDAQDLTQEIWIKVYFALGDFRFQSGFSTWLIRICVNTCINYLKRARRISYSEDIGEIENGSLPDPDNCIDVTKLLSGLSIWQRMLLTLKYVEGLTYEEIAELTGKGLSSVKMTINRAKDKLLRSSSVSTISEDPS